MWGLGRNGLPNLVDLLLATAQVERTSLVDWRRIETEEEEVLSNQTFLSLKIVTYQFLIKRSVILVPRNFNSNVFNFFSHNIFRRIKRYTCLVLERTGGEDDVVGTVHKGVPQLADNISELLRWEV